MPSNSITASLSQINTRGLKDTSNKATRTAQPQIKHAIPKGIAKEEMNEQSGSHRSHTHTPPKSKRKRLAAPLTSDITSVMNPNAEFLTSTIEYSDVLGITLTDPLSHIARIDDELDAIRRVRSSVPSTMAFRGEMFGLKNLRILIDSGSTREALISSRIHISEQVLDRSEDFSLRLLTGGGVLSSPAARWSAGETIRVSGKSATLKDVVQTSIGDLPYDVILGYPFLARLNPTPNWRTGQLRFDTFSWYPTKGEEDIQMTMLSAMSAAHLVKNEGAELILLSAVEQLEPETVTASSRIDPDLSEEQHDRLEQLLHSYDDADNPLFIMRDGMPHYDKFMHKRPKDWQFKLPLKPDARAPKSGLRRYSQPEIAEIRRVVSYLLERKFIQPSSSRFSSAVMLVRKSDGTFRFVMDFRQLNEQCYHSVNPLPDIRALTDKLANAKYMSTLDAVHGYYQIPMDPKDSWKTAFTTPFGQFEWRVLSMGLTGAPSHFQMIMDRLFGPLTDHGAYVACMIDDILVFSNTFEEHFLHLKAVLDTCKANTIFLYLKKCFLAAPSVIYLGNKVGGGKREPDPRKKQALLDHPEPTTTTELRSFLGLGNYLSIYIQKWADMCQPFGPLRGLAKNAKISLNAEQRSSFLQIKQALTSAPILRLPNFSKRFYIQLDASKTGIGSVLMQKYDGLLMPVAYRSRLPSKAQLKWPIHELELFALIDATQHFRPYLLDREFSALCDHKPLEHLKTQEFLSMRQIRYLDHLSMFSYTFVYIKGEENIFADPLSRPPGHIIDYNRTRPSFKESTCMLCRLAAEEEGLKSLEQPFSAGAPGLLPAKYFSHSCADTGHEQAVDGHIHCMLAANLETDVTSVQSISGLVLPDFEKGYGICKFSMELNKILLDPHSKHHYKKKYTLHKGLIYLNPNANEHEGVFRLIIPNFGDLRKRVIALFHDTVAEGHRDAAATYLRLRERFYFPNMEQHVRKFCKTCDRCTRNKYSTGRKMGLLQPLKYPTVQPWQELTTDFATGLPKSRTEYSKVEYDAVQIFVCRISGRVRLLKARATDTAADTAANFVENMFPTTGLPRSIVSDRDPKFTATFYQTVAKLLGVQLRLTSAHNPQADGQSERAVGIVTTMLRIFINYDQNNWADNLSCLEFALNRHAKRARGGETPFLITEGYNPFSPADLGVQALLPDDAPRDQAAMDYVARQRLAAARAQDAIIAAQDVAARSYNKKHVQHEYKVGDLILLRKDHVFPPGERDRPSFKMREKYVGPFKITELIGHNAVRLDFSKHKLRNHPVFSVGSTKLYPSDTRVARGDHAPSEDGDVQDYVDKVLKMKTVGKGGRKQRHWLVQWKYAVDSLADPMKNWLPYDNFKSSHGINQQLVEYEETRTGLHGSVFSDWAYDKKDPGSVTTEADGFKVYHALAGETLHKISTKFDLRLQDLYEQNVMGYGEWSLTHKSKLQASTQLRFPSYT